MDTRIGIARKHLFLPSEEFELIREHAEAAFPNECCGFFYGKVDDYTIAVSEIHPVDNAKEGDQRRRFEISPLDYMRAEQYALESGLQLLGVYHSHPNHPAIPSVHDWRQAVPNFSYIIISVKDGKYDHIKSWRLSKGGPFIEENII